MQSSMWEILSDVYRDFVLTGIFGALVIAAFRVGSLHAKVMEALLHFQAALDSFKAQVITLTGHVDRGFEDTRQRHESIQHQVQQLEVQTAERLAKAEEALRAD